MGEGLYGRLICKKISIIIVYNTERFLRRCLDSVQNQSYSNWECIIVDDGSYFITLCYDLKFQS